jgi:hypothetical protein
MHRLIKLLFRTHWTIHCLGVAGLFAILIALRSLIFSQGTERIDLALFDLIGGLAELGLAIVLLLREKRERRTGRHSNQ